MIAPTLRTTLLLAALAIWAGAASAADVPAISQVYQAAHAGRLDQAQAMMHRVLQAHPDSAKAHYVEAELLAAQHRLAPARQELSKAQQLGPGLPFVQPQSARMLEARLYPDRLARSGRGSSGVLWPGALVSLGILLLGAFFIRSFFARRTSGLFPRMGSPFSSPFSGAVTGPVGMSGAGIGSGIVSGLASGVALGAGLVAGETIAHRFIDGNRVDAADPSLGAGGLSPDPLGGDDFGMDDSTASWYDGGGADFSDPGGGGFPDLGGDGWT